MRADVIQLDLTLMLSLSRSASSGLYDGDPPDERVPSVG